MQLEYQRLDSLSEEHGDSFYIFSPSEVRRAFKTIKNVFSHYTEEVIIAYAFKANYISGVCDEIRRLGVWAEVCNQVEFEKAVKAGIPINRIIYNGPGKTRKNIERPLLDGSIVNVDSLEELEDIALMAVNNPQCEISVGIRCYLQTDRGIGSRFGISIDQNLINKLKHMLRKNKNIKITCLHCHIKGRKVHDWHQKIEEMVKYYSLFCLNGIDVKYIDFGGGLPIDDIKEMEYIAMDMINALDNKCNAGITLPSVILEPGAEMVASSMCLVSKVVRTKKYKSGCYAVIHASRFHVDPMKRRKDFRCTVVSKNECVMNEDESIIVGDTCLEDDIFAIIKCNLHSGDYLIFHDLGAYVINLVPQFGFEKFEVVINGG